MRATWYKLEDGRAVDPAEVSTRDDGRLVHASGALVAQRGDVPYTTSVDLSAPRPEHGFPAQTRELDAGKGGKGYEHRGHARRDRRGA